ncbi:MAG TPA: energy transducer TonB [Bryobacteraceae bacterium]
MASPSPQPGRTSLPEEQDFASWKHPYRDASIYVHRDLVHRLSSQSVQHLKKDTEIGGILWGKPAPDGSVLILNVTPVTSSGTRFNTTTVDTRSLTQTLNSPSPDPTLSPIGFFRSHIREGLGLSTQDRTLFADRFSDPDSLVLLLKPFQAGICTAAFFFWNSGSLPEESELEVPFVFEDPTRPGPAASDEEESIVDMLRESALRHRTLHAKHQPDLIAMPRPQPRPKRSFWPNLIAGALITLLLIVAGATAVLFWPTIRTHLQAMQTPAPAGVNLQAVPGDDGRLAVTWNRNAPSVLQARGGTLFINDGRFSPKLSLTPDQLRSGKLLYAPKTAHVEFRLALDLDGSRTLTESVLVANAKRRPRAHASARHLDPEAQFSPNPPSDDPDSAEPAAPAAAQHDNPVIASLPAPPPSPRPNHTTGVYTPPQVVQEMMPATRPAGRFAKIAVQVSVDKTGRVVSARAEHGAVASDALAQIALSAARQWRFQPATLNGKPVPAEYTVVFVFRPQLH